MFSCHLDLVLKDPSFCLYDCLVSMAMPHTHYDVTQLPTTSTTLSLLMSNTHLLHHTHLPHLPLLVCRISMPHIYNSQLTHVQHSPPTSTTLSLSNTHLLHLLLSACLCPILIYYIYYSQLTLVQYSPPTSTTPSLLISNAHLLHLLLSAYSCSTFTSYIYYSQLVQYSPLTSTTLGLLVFNTHLLLLACSCSTCTSFIYPSTTLSLLMFNIYLLHLPIYHSQLAHVQHVPPSSTHLPLLACSCSTCTSFIYPSTTLSLLMFNTTYNWARFVWMGWCSFN